MKLGEVRIGVNEPPFIIAEMSGNHNHSLTRALEIVDAAARAGAHAFKVQTYTADTMTLDVSSKEFIVNNVDSDWHNYSLYELYNQAHTPWEWHEPIFQRARSLGMYPFSSPFDETAVDFLETLDVPFYKIASFENTDLNLIRKVASTGKPIIISCGIASVADIYDAVRTVNETGVKQVVLLKCTSNYPAIPRDANILTIPHMREMFSCEVGLSDHTMGIGVAVASVALGARVIEKHFTLSRAEGGIDSSFSLEPNEMKQLVTETHRAFESLGKISYEVTSTERSSLQFKRSLYVTKDLKEGDILNKDNVRAIRPGYGLSPKYFDVVLGNSVCKSVDRGTPLHWDLIKSDNESAI